MYTPLTAGSTCGNYANAGYLHIKDIQIANAEQTFTIALSQINAACDELIAPFPETWGGVDVRDYMQSVTVNGVTTTDVYVPVSHFQINLARVTSLSFKAFLDTSTVTIGLIEFVLSVPSGYAVPAMKVMSPWYKHCTVPNTIAIGVTSR